MRTRHAPLRQTGQTPWRLLKRPRQPSAGSLRNLGTATHKPPDLNARHCLARRTSQQAVQQRCKLCQDRCGILRCCSFTAARLHHRLQRLVGWAGGSEYCVHVSPCEWLNNAPPHVNQVDVCSICGGDNSTCVDCSGERYGIKIPKRLDKCGTCDRDRGNDCKRDCAGIWGGKTKGTTSSRIVLLAS